MKSKKLEYLNSENMKKPYINVEFGTPERKLSEVKRIRVGKNMEGIEDLLKNNNDIDLKIEREDIQNSIYIGEGKNQEEILEWVEKYMEVLEAPDQQRKKIKIWCEGHLPIREIIVGPGEKQEEIKESLEYYKNTTYWLRYIDIKMSKIPFRS